MRNRLIQQSADGTTKGAFPCNNSYWTSLIARRALSDQFQGRFHIVYFKLRYNKNYFYVTHEQWFAIYWYSKTSEISLRLWKIKALFLRIINNLPLNK